MASQATSKISGIRVFVAFTIAIAGCGKGDDSELVLWSSDWRAREVVATQWDTLWASGSVDDSILLNPFLLTSDGQHLFVFDAGGKRVVALEAASGQFLWEFGGEGAGPDEFRGVRDIKVDGSGGVYVLDPQNNRVVHLDASGEVLSRIPLSASGYAEQLAPLSRGRVALLTASADSPFVVVNEGGTVERRLPVPWNGYSRLEGLARQGYIAAREGRWAFGFSMGNGWFGFEDDESLGGTGRYLEHTAFPRVLVNDGPSGTIKQFAEYNPCSGCSLALADSILYVHFGGFSDARKQIVDLYRFDDGTYLRSLRLPHEAVVIEVVGDVFFVLTEEPFPSITALRLRGPVR
jgi:hypothetical protein